jgi:hypothetical protein
MKTLLILPALLLLGACVGGPKGDIASYDALKDARAACRAKGEDLVLRDAGNEQRMSAYECKRK